MKTLYGEDGKLTREGCELRDDVSVSLRRLFELHMRFGLTAHDICYMIAQGARNFRDLLEPPVKEGTDG